MKEIEHLLKPLTQTDVMVGNIISVFGKTEIVTGITPRPDGTFFMHHSSSNQENNPLGEGILFDGYPIVLTDEWKVSLNIDKYDFPEWLKFVHEAQNYLKWYANVDIFPQIDWTKIPLSQD